MVAPNRAKLTLMVARKPMIFCFVLCDFGVIRESDAQNSKVVRRKRHLKAEFETGEIFQNTDNV